MKSGYCGLLIKNLALSNVESTHSPVSCEVHGQRSRDVFDRAELNAQLPVVCSVVHSNMLSSSVRSNDRPIIARSTMPAMSMP